MFLRKGEFGARGWMRLRYHGRRSGHCGATRLDTRSLGSILMSMLFFFELFLFVLVMLTLALGEFVSRGLALTLWLVVSAFTLVGYLFARQSVKSVLAGGSAIPLSRPTDVHPQATTEAHAVGEHGNHAPAAETPQLAPLTPIDEKWASTLLYNWRRTNVLLVIGAVVVGGWYWLGLRG